MFKWVSIFVGLLAMFVTCRLIALTEDGETLWFVLDGRAKLIEDGMQVEGWLHREWKDRVLIITRKGGPLGRESYLVGFGGASRMQCDLLRGQGGVSPW